MEQLYHVNYWHPRKGLDKAGFSIQLWPAWKRELAKVDFLNAKAAETYIERFGPEIIEHYFSYIYKLWEEEKYTKEERKFKAKCELMIRWGEWGPEHITVPGNACGLDIGYAPGGPRDGKTLLPHNVDTLEQASALLEIFLFFADTVVLNRRATEIRNRGEEKT